MSLGTSHETSRFFSLPLELRDMVYHELWRDTPQMSLMVFIKEATYIDEVVVRYGDCAASPANLSRSESTQSVHLGLPQWLQSNKAFLDEGLNQLFRKAIWIVDRQQRTPSRKEIAHNTKAGITTARGLIISMEISNFVLERGVYGFMSIQSKVIFPVMNSAYREFMSTPMPHLTSLHVKLEYSWISNLSHKYTIDLSCIETTLHLKRFGMSISMDLDTDSELLPPIIDKEARRLACIFVGTDYCLEVEENMCNWVSVEGLTSCAGLLVTWTFVRNETG